ncbi:O-antigen ligase family protein [Maricaulis sp. D1M11]|uniref:O-antigen ligase family protein n=1 Tax=Maricaulis sp. D1M11 TaxID=3076117 RepID=UPI0039B3E653
MAVSGMRTGICAIVLLATSAIAAAMGGLLLSTLAALFGLLVFPFNPSEWRAWSSRWLALPVVLFLAWVAISFLWSPHDKPDQVWKTGLGIPLYTVLVLRVGHLSGIWRIRAEAAYLAAAAAVGLFFVLEVATGFMVTQSYKLSVEGAVEVSDRFLRDAVTRSLGHGAAFLIMISAPAALLAWRSGGLVIGVLIMAMAGLAAVSFSTEVNIVAIAAASVAAGLAFWKPRSMVALSFGVFAGSFLIIPMVLPTVVALLPTEMTSGLPWSWQERLGIWMYAGELIQDKPWFGHGLDASRPLSGVLELNTWTREALPLHPHNAPLHVWLETGLVGATLLAISLIAIGGRISSAPRLSRPQAVAAVWVLVSYASLLYFGYGVWQEWHQGAVAIAATGVFFLGAQKPAA